MLKQIRKAFLNIFMAVGGVLVALILLEMGVRVFLPLPYGDAKDVALLCSDQLGWRGNPHYEETFATDGYKHSVKDNSVGMHDGEHQLSKPENTFRILMLGDSFVRAAHVNETETSHQVLEELLNSKNATGHFEVISAGMSAWSTSQELIYYRNEGRFYKPDLVLLMFYIGNDVQDNLPGQALTLNGRNCYAPYFVICGGQLDVTPWLYAPGVDPAIGQCSFGRKMLVNILGRIYQYSRLYAQIEPLFAAGQTRFHDLSYYLYIPEEDELLDYAWQLTFAIINQLHQEVKKDGAELAVVLISPAALVNLPQMSPSELERLYQTIPDLRKAQPDLPNRKLSERLSREGIKVLDLQPLFIQHIEETGETLYFQHDGHWNVAGNRVAAELIYDWLNGEVMGPFK
jgi:hypothetical protein